MASRIEDYALIGDCHTAGLVAKDGSIDWLCFPRFDSGACFAALLGTPEHGRWIVAPDGEVARVTRNYRQGTLVLETHYEMADGGAVTLIDFMPPRTRMPDVVRIVQGVRGRVKMKTEVVIRLDYGWVVPWVRHLEQRPGHPSGVRAIAGPDTLHLRTHVPLHGEGLCTRGDFVVGEGERVTFQLTWSPTHRPDPGPGDPEALLTSTEKWWRDWSDRCTYTGAWREAILRSLITLKAMTFAPTGGIVAAATTSLPEQLGGVRNWDYRYCWIRDATFTLLAMMFGGFYDEANAFRDWIVNAAAGTPEDMQIMYGVAGERRLTELELTWLPGYENSKPVRIGNGAYRQRQLDVYGELMDVFHHARTLGLPTSDDAWRVQRALLRFLETAWREPDEGIWEVRGPRRHFTHSKVMAWVAFDRGVKAVEQFGRDDHGQVDRWRTVRDEIHAEVCREGFNASANAFTQFYGSRDPDASLLTLPLVGFLPATDPRIRGTVALVEKELVKDGFVERYPTRPDVDGLPPGEGAFLICTFWLVDNLALQGRIDEACAMFERLLALRNDVGLLAEEYDWTARRQVGNFPQAFSHVGLINTARILMQVAKERGVTLPCES